MDRKVRGRYWLRNLFEHLRNGEWTLVQLREIIEVNWDREVEDFENHGVYVPGCGCGERE